MCKLGRCGLLMTSTTGGACAIFYTHKEDNAPINKTTKKHPKNKILCEKESANNRNEHVAKAMEHKVGALEVTKRWTTARKLKRRGAMREKSLRWTQDGSKHSQKNDK